MRAEIDVTTGTQAGASGETGLLDTRVVGTHNR